MISMISLMSVGIGAHDDRVHAFRPPECSAWSADAAATIAPPRCRAPAAATTAAGVRTARHQRAKDFGDVFRVGVRQVDDLGRAGFAGAAGRVRDQLSGFPRVGRVLPRSTRLLLRSFAMI